MRTGPDNKTTSESGQDEDKDKDALIAELRAAVSARDEFIAVAAHELRNPLTPILAQVQRLRARAEREGMSPGMIKNLDILQVAVDHYLRRATTLLEISRLNVGRLRLTATRLDMCQLVRQSAERHEQMAAFAGSKLEVRVPHSAVGCWDELALELVLDNLVSNALRYGDNKPILMEVEASMIDVAVHVVDQGIGIAAQDLQRIFERFERAVVGANTGGFGIGLWLANQLVRAHGGTIEVRSELGQGSRFTVRLPREGGEPSEREQIAK